MACMRLAAWRHTTLWGPSRTDGRDLLAPMGRQAVQDDSLGRGASQQLVVDGVARERLAPQLGLVLLAHRRPHVGVEGIGTGGRLGRIGGHLELAAQPRHPGHVVAVGLVALGARRA